MFVSIALRLFCDYYVTHRRHHNALFISFSEFFFFNIKSWQNVTLHFFLDANGIFFFFLFLALHFTSAAMWYSIRFACDLGVCVVYWCLPPSVISRATSMHSQCVTRKRMEKVNNCCSRFVILLGMFVFCRSLSIAPRTQYIDDIPTLSYVRFCLSESARVRTNISFRNLFIWPCSHRNEEVLQILERKERRCDIKHRVCRRRHHLRWRR